MQGFFTMHGKSAAGACPPIPARFLSRRRKSGLNLPKNLYQLDMLPHLKEGDSEINKARRTSPVLQFFPQEPMPRLGEYYGRRSDHDHGAHRN